MALQEFDHRPSKDVPENWRFHERDTSRFSVLTHHVIPESKYLALEGTEIAPRTFTFQNGEVHEEVKDEPRQAEYFFDEEGQAVAFRRFHNPDNQGGAFHYYTVYPDPELNTYYRWKTVLNPQDLAHYLPSREEMTPQIWFGRLFTDHGAAKQQDEMAKNLGAIYYRGPHLQRVSLGQLFVNGKENQESPSVGQPSLKATVATPVLAEQFSLSLLSDPSKPTLEQVGNCDYVILDGSGKPIFSVNYWGHDQTLNVEQRHLDSGFRKLIRARLLIDISTAANLATSRINPNQDYYNAVEPWMEMAREVGCSLSLGQASLRKVFGD